MKKWIIDPPCEAEIFLRKLFEDGLIEAEDTPLVVQKRHDIFKEFSTAVFRNNFKRLRCLDGLLLKNTNRRGSDICETLPNVPGYLPLKKIKCEDDSENYKDDFVEQISQPALMALYKKICTLEEYYIVLVSLISGATNIRFILSDDGMRGCIKYDWPKPMYDLNLVFAQDKKSSTFEAQKVVALDEQLAKIRKSSLEIPEGRTIIKFPSPVQPTGHLIQGIEIEETQVIRLELPLFKNSYTKTEAKINFRK